ncbi:hypothetical protein ACFYXS_05950 [Streptomyces sp. NPDC002574]|uniref:hypothetical protein n=1 Tax=Streptomyces sp. NPDC002574 TaxID=3364652 RepID=UPI00368DEBD9
MRSRLDEMQEDPGHAEAFVVAEAVSQGMGLLVGDGALNEIQKSSRTFDGLLKSLVGLAVLGREFAQGGEVSNLRTDHDTPFLPSGWSRRGGLTAGYGTGDLPIRDHDLRLEY